MLKVVFSGLILFVSGFANATLITQEFNDGDSLAAWVVDRSAPAGFEIINNELVMSVSGPSFQDDFKNTHGMKLNIGQSTYLSIDMFIDSAWTNNERYGGMWAQLIDSIGDLSGWPLIEFKGTEGVKTWDNFGWQTTGTNINYDEFNNFKLQITGNGVEYYLNNTLLYTDSVTDAKYFSNVLLNAKYEGNDFTVKYDNLVYGTVDVPEPSTLAIFALGIIALASRRFKQQ